MHIGSGIWLETDKGASGGGAGPTDGLLWGGTSSDFLLWGPSATDYLIWQ